MSLDGDAAERRRRGGELFREAMRIEPPGEPIGDPFLENGLLDTVFAEVWSRDGLTRRERRLITLTAVAACGDATAVEAHVRAALATGDLTVEELSELTLQFACTPASRGPLRSTSGCGATSPGPTAASPATDRPLPPAVHGSLARACASSSSR
jgi:alkylhydroperoxidase/carboxymuconolactone decarboxylase family protein YurZ